MKVQAYLFTNAGDQPLNEDFANYTLDDDLQAFVVADGQNSKSQDNLLSQYLAEQFLNDTKEAAQQKTGKWLSKEASILVKNAATFSGRQFSGQTASLTAMILKDGDLFWTSAGNCRLYCLEDGRISLLTRDHTTAFQKYMSGAISRNELNNANRQDTLLKSFGMSGCVPDIGSVPGAIKDGTAFLLCSDGFWQYLYDEEILLDRLKAGTPKQWAQNMLLRLMERRQQHTDNLTLLTVIAGKEN